MRWLLLPLGLAIAAAAAFLLLRSPVREPAPVAAGPAAPAARRVEPAKPEPDRPMGEIDEASRRALERVLEREGIE